MVRKWRGWLVNVGNFFQGRKQSAQWALVQTETSADSLTTCWIRKTPNWCISLTWCHGTSMRFHLFCRFTWTDQRPKWKWYFRPRFDLYKLVSDVWPLTYSSHKASREKFKGEMFGSAAVKFPPVLAAPWGSCRCHFQPDLRKLPHFILRHGYAAESQRVAGVTISRPSQMTRVRAAWSLCSGPVASFSLTRRLQWLTDIETRTDAPSVLKRTRAGGEAQCSWHWL